MVKANRWANWLDNFMSSDSARITAYTAKPEAKQVASQATHVVKAIKAAYIPRSIVVSSR